MSESQINPGLSRREIFRMSASMVSALPFIGLAGAAMAQAPAAKAPAASAKPGTPTCNPVPDSDPVAKAIKYAVDGSKVADRPAKMGVEGKDQACSSCQLFTKQGEANGQEFGKCTMIATGCVNGKGWCTAWVKKA